MARGSGAGTGVIVALVVSVVCNVGLLTITFMMYTGKAEALENEARAKSELSAFVRGAGLQAQEMCGLEYNPITGRYALTQDTSVNYLMATRRPAEA